MKRKKEIILISHCILNVNAKVFGIAHTQGALAIVKDIIDDGSGIIQLPCPEMTFLGTRRWGMSKEQYDTPVFRKHCREILMPVIDQLIDYTRSGYTILGILGMDGSPSCGVNLTNSGYTGGSFRCQQAQPQHYTLINASGVYMEVFNALLQKNNLAIPMIGLDEFAPQKSSWQTVKNEFLNLL